MTSKLIQDLLETGKKVVVVDEIISIPDEIKLNRNLLVVCGDPGEAGMLQQARCSYASALICLTPDDTINLSAAITAASLPTPTGALNPPDIYCHLSGTRTIERLNSLDFFRKQRGSNGVEKQCYIQGFNVYERASRMLLEEYAPDRFVPALHSNDHQPHLAVAGLSILGEAVVMQMARMAHYAGLRKTRVTIIEQSTAACEEWIKAYPAVKDILEIHFIHDLSEHLSAKKMDALFVCYDQYADTLDLLYNLMPLEETACKVIIATNQQTSFLQAYRASNVYHFAVFDQTLSEDAILREKIDDLARIIHAAYLEDQKKGKTFNPSKETHQEWQNLPERTKNQNRNQADHLWIKVRAAECIITPLHEEGVPYDFTSDADLHERLSEVEHNRWMAHEQISNPGSRHESLVPYAALTDQVKQWDRNAVKNIPALLARLGLKPVKKPVSQ